MRRYSRVDQKKELVSLRRLEKVIITIAIIFTIILCAGLYVNHKLNILAENFTGAGLLFSILEEDPPLYEEENPPTGIVSPFSREELPSLDIENQAHAGIENNNPPGTGALGPEVTIPETQIGSAINAAVQEKLNRPLEKKDLLKAGLIIFNKLDKGEIGYLYKVGSRDSIPRDELKKVRELLLSRLSKEDLSTLRELGAKYGKQLRILDPDLRIQ